MQVTQEFVVAILTNTEPAVITGSTLSFDTDDPYAITMGFEYNNSWTFSRDLFLTGGGAGDVRVFRNEEFYVVSLMGTHGIVFPRQSVEEFFVGTEVLVPVGKESETVDWDSEISMLLDSEPDSD